MRVESHKSHVFLGWAGEMRILGILGKMGKMGNFFQGTALDCTDGTLDGTDGMVFWGWTGHGLGLHELHRRHERHRQHGRENGWEESTFYHRKP